MLHSWYSAVTLKDGQNPHNPRRKAGHCFCRTTCSVAPILLIPRRQLRPPSFVNGCFIRLAYVPGIQSGLTVRSYTSPNSRSDHRTLSSSWVSVVVHDGQVQLRQQMRSADVQEKKYRWNFQGRGVTVKLAKITISVNGSTVLTETFVVFEGWKTPYFSTQVQTTILFTSRV